MIAIVMLLFLYTETSTAYSFQEEPEDTDAIVGMAVTLRCIVNNWGTMDVLWYDQGDRDYVSRDRDIIRQSADSERFSIIGDAFSGEYFLHIRNLTTEDAGLYSCFLFEDGSFRLSSRDALLQVYPTPHDGFPECSITPDVTTGGKGPGDWVMLTCIAEGGSPFSRLDWIRSFEILPASFLDGNEPRSIYELRLSEYHNGAVFSCVENNPVLEHRRSCSLMPFYLPTNVTLISKPRLSVIGDDVTLICGVQALPNFGFNYTWFLNGEDISPFTDNAEHFSFSDDGSEIHLQSINASFNHSLFECNVLNVIELEGKASLLLKLFSDEILAKVEPVESGGLFIALLLGGVSALVILLIVTLIVVHRRKRIGILHLLKVRRPSLKLSQRYTEHQRYTRSSKAANNITDGDAESTHSVLICTTPRDAIEEHLKELTVQHSRPARQQPPNVLLTRPKHGPPPPPIIRTESKRGRTRPVISGPISVVIPDFPVVLRDLNIKNRDTLSIDEDYVSDTDTDWDL